MSSSKRNIHTSAIRIPAYTFEETSRSPRTALNYALHHFYSAESLQVYTRSVVKCLLDASQLLVPHAYFGPTILTLYIVFQEHSLLVR